VKELIDSSYYKPDGSPDENAKGAYSWIKTPVYDGIPLETGPLARAVISDDAEFKKAMSKLGQKEMKSSVMGRILARATESVKLCEYLFARTEEFVMGDPSIKSIDLSKVTDYKMIVPSTWNFGPSVGGKPGVAEKAVLGTPVNYEGSSVEVGRVIRSFDPCTACSVH
jgi:Ni,Fe-hydrogenase I large subunit